MARVRERPLCLFNCGHSFEECPMKRILLALVLALGVVSVIGCSGGSPTSPKTTSTKP